VIRTGASGAGPTFRQCMRRNAIQADQSSLRRRNAATITSGMPHAAPGCASPARLHSRSEYRDNQNHRELLRRDNA